jgi:hypothetical protein
MLHDCVDKLSLPVVLERTSLGQLFVFWPKQYATKPKLGLPPIQLIQEGVK